MFQFEELGIFIRIFDKMLRLKNILWDNSDKFAEEEKNKIILNSIIDTIGYSLGWLEKFVHIQDLREFAEKDKY
jgi:Na+-translocating ferredoxin:NAD+ oxidoreductase RnfE subunit